MLAKCGAEVIALSRTQADLDSLKKEVLFAQDILNMSFLKSYFC